MLFSYDLSLLFLLLKCGLTTIDADRSTSQGGSIDKPAGFYLYDLNSTHGSFHNKNQCFPKTYYRLRVGHMMKFGGSTRLLILQGPEEDTEAESECGEEPMQVESTGLVEKGRCLTSRWLIWMEKILQKQQTGEFQHFKEWFW